MAVSTKITLRDLSRIAIFAAIIAALTFPGAIPLGIGVPITLQTLGVMLAGVCHRQSVAFETWNPKVIHFPLP